MMSYVSTIFRFISQVFPVVNQELNYWRQRAGQIPDIHLRTQALASITTKKFHAQGGAIYALHPNARVPQDIIRFIVALQTISDYLDNLCDRLGVDDEAAFFWLHEAMMDAVIPNRKLVDYYSNYPYKNDGGYLGELVKVCRNEISKQPNYSSVLPLITHYVQQYSYLQVYKHLDWQTREKKLRRWARLNLEPETEIFWQEYAAASGSTLGMFYLFLVASDPYFESDMISSIDRVYFPWVTGLHILLDYYIDFEEDLETGDLNFTSYYTSSEERISRIGYFISRSYEMCLRLPNPDFHQLIICGLLAMYLSDPKALAGDKLKASISLVRQGGIQTQLYHRCCIWLRRKGVI